jgi:hypothetical protein
VMGSDDMWKDSVASEAIKVQSKISQQAASKRHQRFLDDASDTDKARLLSASQPAAKLWLTTMPEENELRLSNEEFRAAVKLRLGLPSSVGNSGNVSCVCDSSVRIVDTQHFHVCDLTRKGAVFDRHELIVRTIADVCRQANVIARTSHHYLKRRAAASSVVPDLFVYSADSAAKMLDVTVRYPATDSMVSQHRAHEVPLVACKVAENSKNSKYDTLAVDNGMSFVAFAVEVFGAIGRSALKFLKDVAEQVSSPHLFYVYSLRRISIAIQRGNALVLQHGKQLLRSVETRSSRLMVPDFSPLCTSPSAVPLLAV